MRIISGKFKGRVVEMPRLIRPTSDKVREALFEILKKEIAGAEFLDVYCGSGAVGIEALSRGANGAGFIDNDPKCVKIVKKNLCKLGAWGLSGINIYNMEALKALNRLKKSGKLFDIVFIDPPYYKDMAKNTLIALSGYDILARNAVVILETYKKEVIPETAGALKKLRASAYGDTKLEFFIYEEAGGIPGHF